MKARTSAKKRPSYQQQFSYKSKSPRIRASQNQGGTAGISATEQKMSSYSPNAQEVENFQRLFANGRLIDSSSLNSQFSSPPLRIKRSKDASNVDDEEVSRSQNHIANQFSPNTKSAKYREEKQGSPISGSPKSHIVKIEIEQNDQSSYFSSPDKSLSPGVGGTKNWPTFGVNQQMVKKPWQVSSNSNQAPRSSSATPIEEEKQEYVDDIITPEELQSRNPVQAPKGKTAGSMGSAERSRISAYQRNPIGIYSQVIGKKKAVIPPKRLAKTSQEIHAPTQTSQRTSTDRHNDQQHIQIYKKRDLIEMNMEQEMAQSQRPEGNLDLTQISLQRRKTPLGQRPQDQSNTLIQPYQRNSRDSREEISTFSMPLSKSQETSNPSMSKQRQVFDRLAALSPRRFKTNAQADSEVFMQRGFQPQINSTSIEILRRQKAEGKFNNIGSVFEHLGSADVVERMKRQSKRKAALDNTLIRARKNATQPNTKSSIIIGKKFNEQFVKTVQTLTNWKPKALPASSIHSRIWEHVAGEINFTEFRNILFCLGFIKSLDNSQTETSINQLTLLWEMLVEMRNDDATAPKIKTLSLYNFLCYLQSLELLIDYEHLENIRNETSLEFIPNKYGYSMSGIIFISNLEPEELRLNQDILIKDYYDLLNNKKEFERQVNLQANQKKALYEMRVEETFKPMLAPKTSRIKSTQQRNQLSRQEYSNILHQKSPSKQQRLLKLKHDLDKKEIENCTFKPHINAKVSKARIIGGPNPKSRSPNLPVAATYQATLRPYTATSTTITLPAAASSGMNRTERREYIPPKTARPIDSKMQASPSSGSVVAKDRQLQKKYVNDFLYKPKVRKEDKSKDEIEFEKQKKECLFKPVFATKKSPVNSTMKQVKPRVFDIPKKELPKKKAKSPPIYARKQGMLPSRKKSMLAETIAQAVSPRYNGPATGQLVPYGQTKPSSTTHLPQRRKSPTIYRSEQQQNQPQRSPGEQAEHYPIQHEADLPKPKQQQRVAYRETRPAQQASPEISDEECLIQMEVKISQGVEDTIMINQGDNMYEKIAAFVRKHKLDKGKHEKLIRLMESNLPPQNC